MVTGMICRSADGARCGPDSAILRLARGASVTAALLLAFGVLLVKRRLRSVEADLWTDCLGSLLRLLPATVAAMVIAWGVQLPVVSTATEQCSSYLR
jgi:hypothetical protein